MDSSEIDFECDSARGLGNGKNVEVEYVAVGVEGDVGRGNRLAALTAQPPKKLLT